MRRAWIAALTAMSAMILGACSSGPTQEQSPAGVEERQPSAAQSGAQPQAVKPPSVARVDLTGKPAPLKDPNNILSRRSIFYDLDQYEIKTQFKDLVEAHGKYLRDNPGAKMLIQGNTDERGSREYNVGLGQRRSDGVKKMLMLLGAREVQIESVSLGEEKPRAEGHDEASWAQNRRSDMLYQGEY